MDSNPVRFNPFGNSHQAECPAWISDELGTLDRLCDSLHEPEVHSGRHRQQSRVSESRVLRSSPARERKMTTGLASMSSLLVNFPHTIAMRFFLLTAAVAFAQSPAGQHDNYYSVNRDSQVGERLATQLQANIAAVPEPRMNRVGGPLAA